jgi:hypothetical protein
MNNPIIHRGLSNLILVIVLPAGLMVIFILFMAYLKIKPPEKMKKEILVSM